MKRDLYWFIRNAQRTAIAFVANGSVAIFMTAMQGVSDNRAITSNLHLQADRPLPDLLMDYAPSWMPIEAADLFLNSLIAFSIGMFFLSWWWRIKAYGAVEAHFRSFRIARRFMWMLTAAYALRAFTVLSTTMPPSDTRCTFRQRSWLEIPFMAFEIMSKRGNSCTDKIFSGHSSMATLLGLTWIGALWRPGRQTKLQPQSQHQPTNKEPASVVSHLGNLSSDLLKSVDAFASFKPARVPLWRKLAALGIALWVGAVYVTCVLCKNHYSIDIVVAVLVCSGIFGVLQLSVKMVAFSHRAGALPLFMASKTGYTYTAAAQDDPERGAKPLEEEVEVAGESVLSPISMREIEVVEGGDFALKFEDKKLIASPSPAHNYLPRITGPFERYLRMVAWMDGYDLQHKSGIMVD